MMYILPLSISTHVYNVYIWLEPRSRSVHAWNRTIQETKWTFPVSAKWQSRWSDLLEVSHSELCEDVPPWPPHPLPAPGVRAVHRGSARSRDGLHRWVENGCMRTSLPPYVVYILGYILGYIYQNVRLNDSKMDQWLIHTRMHFWVTTLQDAIVISKDIFQPRS